MFRRLVALSALLLAACGSSSEKEEESERPRLPAPMTSELPAGKVFVTSRESSFMGMLEELEETDVVYVGGTHANADHHLLQLRIIEHLAFRGRLHAIGMEMFQRPAQQALDDYVKGRIDETELAARREFASRWAPYEPWRPILAFARKNRIPVRALGVEGEVYMQVLRGGLDAVPEAARMTLPAVDVTLFPEHRAHLRATHGAGEPDFDGFYLAECLREEVAADGIVRWFRTAPDDGQIVVLAGVERIVKGRGIPERAHRRNGRSYRTVVPIAASAEDFDEEKLAHTYADFLWFTPPAKAAD